ncbi:MAG: hypothetical protein QOD31_4016, partial [Pseudonocardiales bacterium]|nr:hypothetical protein [Pseudonocardiales bacterium]
FRGEPKAEVLVPDEPPTANITAE